MATNRQDLARQPLEPRKGHERRDANAKWIFGIILFLFVFGLSLHGILAGFLSSLKSQPAPTDRWRPSPPPVAKAAPLPPYPRLQVSPPLDLQTFRMREEAELHSYGWIDRKAGVVHIPIERAMDLVLQQGLPTRNSVQSNQAGPSSYQLIQQRPAQHQPEIKGEQ